MPRHASRRFSKSASRKADTSGERDCAAHVYRSAMQPANVIYRHSIATRILHWLNALCVFVVLLSGLQIFNAHPRLY